MKRILILCSLLLTVTFWSCKKEELAPLKADFTISADHARVGDEITFTSISEGAPSRYNWTFEGAEVETSELSQPVVRWLDAGTYTVTLRISNKEDSDEIVKEKCITIDYYTSVKAGFSFDKSMAFNDEYITFTDESEGFPNTVKWTFSAEGLPDVVSTEKNPSLMFEPGVWSVRQEVSSPVAQDFMELKDAFTILDKNAVMSDFTSASRTTYAGGGTVAFKSAATGNVKGYEWTFEGATPSVSSEANPVVTYSAPGKYSVTLRVFNDLGYEHSCTKEGYVTVVPDAGLVFLLPFDGDYQDYGPNGLHPSVYSMGDLAPAYVAGHGDGWGQSMQFPGGEKGKSYAVLQIPEDKLPAFYPQGSGMTVSVWTKISGVSANNALFAQGDCPGVADENNQIWCRFQANHQLRVTAEKVTGSGTVTATDARFDDGTWHHIAIVYARIQEGGEYKKRVSIYLDGEVVGKPATGEDKDVRTVPFFIGCNLRLTNNAWAPENMFGGQMDDFILYNRGLTEDEIRMLASM